MRERQLDLYQDAYHFAALYENWISSLLYPNYFGLKRKTPTRDEFVQLTARMRLLASGPVWAAWHQLAEHTDRFSMDLEIGDNYDSLQYDEDGCLSKDDPIVTDIWNSVANFRKVSRKSIGVTD